MNWRRRAGLTSFYMASFKGSLSRVESVAALRRRSFWYRHAGWEVTNMPEAKTEFWLCMFDRNVQRDAAGKERP